MKSRNLRFFSFGATVLIMAVLVLSGSVNAFILGMTISQDSIDQGKPVSFIVSGKVEANEVINPDYFILKITGLKNTSCSFFPNGTIISGCQDMNIAVLSSADYGYGYGYGYISGEFVFNITLNTGSFPPGNYKTAFQGFTDKGMFQALGEFTILVPGFEGCSIRAKDGIFMINETLFSTKNKLNFYVPLKGAVKGQGYITSQSGRKTFSYKFKVDKAAENSPTTGVIYVTGKSQVNLNKKIDESAIIYIDKKNNKVEIIGKTFHITSMSINFKDNC